MDAASLKRYSTSQMRTCRFCGNDYNAKGIIMHERSCGKKIETRKRDEEYEQSLRNQTKEKRRNGEFIKFVSWHHSPDFYR